MCWELNHAQTTHRQFPILGLRLATVRAQKWSGKAKVTTLCGEHRIIQHMGQYCERDHTAIKEPAQPRNTVL